MFIAQALLGALKKSEMRSLNGVTGELGTGRGGGGSAAPVNNEIWDGKVSGNAFTFYVWRGSDRPAKVTYKGELNAAGDQITFQVGGGPAGRGGGGGQGQVALRHNLRP